MTLEQWSFVAQIVSALAVIASLIFVGNELKHASSAIRLSSSQAHSALYIELVRSVVEDADFSRIWTTGLADPDAIGEADWARFVSFTGAFFRLYEASRVQWLNKQLDKEHWQTVERQAADFRQYPGVKKAWELRSHWYSRDFQNWFEALEPAAVHSPYGRG
jgi:hypothetical protein